MNDGFDKPNIVIPTIRDNKQLSKFFNDWSEDFRGCHIILIEDKKKKELSNFMSAWEAHKSFTYEHYDWTDIEKDLGEDAWIFSRHSDAIRSYGFLKAWQNKAAFIVTLDDDVAPLEPGHHIAEFGKKLLIPREYEHPLFFSTLKDVPPRGTLTAEGEVALVHGMWLKNPDLSGLHQLEHHKTYKDDSYGAERFNEGIVPEGCLFSVCSMNMAFQTDYAIHSYFGLQGSYKPLGSKKLKVLPLDRCGDIWTGYRMKRAADDDGLRCYTGKPYVIHNRASNVWSNISREKVGWAATEDFALSVSLDWSLPAWYVAELKKAEAIWEGLFQND